MVAILRGRAAFLRDDQDRRRMVAYEQAQWLGFSFHDPVKMPAFHTLEARPDAEAAQAAVDDAKVRGWFIMRATRPN